ncbi:MAG: ribosome biogenesis GTPase YlqF [Firmicutes bacterium]|nr:ribosome biogenesis GTPase YlqF [Bacillota bacterium]
MVREEGLVINWFPGHMKRALDQIRDHIKLCDAIIYVLDARAPLSCLNPSFDELVGRKPTLFVLNKIDLAPHGTLDFFKKRQKGTVITLDSRVSGTSKKIVSGLRMLLKERLDAAKAKGIQRPIRAIVIGVTNCGKSTMINNLAGKGKTKTADRPGVTRHAQWIATNEPLLWVLDTPGTLWPRLDDQKVARNLALIGSIKDDVVDIVDLANTLVSDFGLEVKRRGQNEEQEAKAILKDFRSGKLGKFNLDL